MIIVDTHGLIFWHTKVNALGISKFCKCVKNEKGFMISSIQSDHDSEFKNHDFQEFYESNGYNHNFSTPRNPQQNGVVERKKYKFIRNDKNHVKRT